MRYALRSTLALALLGSAAHAAAQDSASYTAPAYSDTNELRAAAQAVI